MNKNCIYKLKNGVIIDYAMDKETPLEYPVSKNLESAFLLFNDKKLLKVGARSYNKDLWIIRVNNKYQLVDKKTGAMVIQDYTREGMIYKFKEIKSKYEEAKKTEKYKSIIKLYNDLISRWYA